MSIDNTKFNIMPLELRGLQHYTNIDNFKKIILDKTWKLSNILSMNDKKECIRKGANDTIFSHIFLASFSNNITENHAMWHIYGKDNKVKQLQEKRNKILMSLSPNCFFGPENFEDMYMDYFGESIKGKCYYNKETKDEDREYLHLVNNYMILIRYLDKNSDAFSRDYSIMGDCDKPEDGYAVSVGSFGKYKTKSWEYEQEVRLLVQTLREPVKPYEKSFLLLRLKDTFFKDMKVILSPWDEGNGEERVRSILEQSKISQEILNTIRIIPSTETGMFE